MQLYDWVKTITFDNGIEIILYMKMATLRCDTYFSKPYYSWGRGQNENANRLLRQCFSKSVSLHNVVFRKIVGVVDNLNRRPGKYFGWKASYEVFEEFLEIDDRRVLARDANSPSKIYPEIFFLF